MSETVLALPSALRLLFAICRICSQVSCGAETVELLRKKMAKSPFVTKSDTVSSGLFSLGEVGGPYIDSQQLPGPKTLTHSLSRVLLLPSRQPSQFKSFEYKGFGVSFVQQKLGKPR